MYDSIMIQPEQLQRGDTVALIAPSSPTNDNGREIALDSLEYLGLNVKVYPSVHLNHGFLSGDDKLRAKDINRAFADPQVKGIFCTRGGYGSVRLLELLDYDIIRENPKVFVGFSDITTLHIVFNQKCNFITYHGPVATSDYRNLDEISSRWLKTLLFEKPSSLVVHNPSSYIPIPIYEGIIEGQLVGGNLAVIASSLGTPYEIDTKGKILFLEDTNEKPYRVDRYLMQLKHSGKLRDCAGIIFGTFNNCDEESPDTLTLAQIQQELILPLEKPTMKNFSAGHTFPNITLPLGRKVRLDTVNCELTLL